MNRFLSKVLQICESNLYLTPILSDSVVTSFRYGPFGELLKQNVRNEWFHSNVTLRDMNVFPFCQPKPNVPVIESVKDQYFQVRSLFGENLPFGLVYSQIPEPLITENVSKCKESKYFRPENSSSMKCVTFTTHDDGLRFFHYWLRQRNIWWRKFSANPSRFSLTDINKDTENVEFACIQAEFPWGIESVEIVKYFSSNVFESLPDGEKELWAEKQKKKRLFPCIVESVTSLETAVFTFLCDAYLEDVRLDSGLPHKVMKLHRKLVPYKTAIVIDMKKGEENEDLINLAEYTSLNLRKSGIQSLMLSRKTKKSAEEMFQFYDILSVPYIIVLKPSTLDDGLFGLRSRETTLQETLHITNIVDHISLCFKNY